MPGVAIENRTLFLYTSPTFSFIDKNPMRPKAHYEKKLLHYTGKAIADFAMIQKGDRVLVCVSGGKDSYALLRVLRLLQQRTHHLFDLSALTVDQGIPGYDAAPLVDHLSEIGVPLHIEKQATFDYVRSQTPDNKTMCSLCARLRRGIIYRYAKENGFTKLALGHHRDDINETLLMSILYNGNLKAMPPKLLTDDKKLVVIRPLVYCQEADIEAFVQLSDFPAVTCSGCTQQKTPKRAIIKDLIQQLAKENPKVPSNILHATQTISPSQLLDKRFWDFKDLEQQQIIANTEDAS